jgi:dTDP-4-dehydrorhamnose 3,5-epimerase
MDKNNTFSNSTKIDRKVVFMSTHSKYVSQVTTQAYGQSSQIEGVQRLPLTLHADDGGNFMEIFRISNEQIEGLDQPFVVRQISLSVMMPGVVKAYHLHEKQDDLWFVPPGNRLLVNLHDVREDSPSFDVHMRLVLGGGQSSLLRVPAGVAHGVGNPYHKAMTLIYATNQQFNPNQPDEQRLPWDAFESDVWSFTKG